MTAGDTSDLIRGPAGSPVELVVRRRDAASPIKLSLSRQSIAVESERYALPLVVLVNEATASMGEIFAAALQEHGAATVVGSTTAGDVARAQLHPLPDGSALMVTEMEIRSPTGKVLNKLGVVPDDMVAVDPAAALPGAGPVLDEAGGP